MKFSNTELSKQLSNVLPQVIWINGDEPLLVQECVDTIIAKAKTENFLDRQIITVENKFPTADLMQHMVMQSLFSDKTLIELRLAAHSWTKQSRDDLLATIENRASDKCLLIVSDKLDSATSRSKCVKLVESQGWLVTCWPPTLDQLPTFIRQRLAKMKLTLDAKSIALIAENGEGNLLAICQTIEKLALAFPPPATITYETCVKILSNSARYDIFSLADAALGGLSARALKILSGLREEGVDPILILWALAKEVRQLSAMQQDIQNGQGIEQVIARFGVWAKRKSVIHAALSRNDPETWQKGLRLCATIDKQIKGVEKGDVWLTLKELICLIAGVKLFEDAL